MGKFYDFVKKHGIIKDVSEAFKEFPVEEEEHKGDINYFINDEVEIYSNYKIGDIVFVNKYDYSDNTPGKNHLFVIVDVNNIAVELEFLAMILSSKIHKEKYKYNIKIEKNKTNKLNKNIL